MDSLTVSTGRKAEGFEWLGATSNKVLIHSNKESILGVPNFNNIWWLEKAIETSKRVCRIKMSNGSATGFLISDDLLITNNHVFESKKDAERSVLQFDYRLLSDGNIADKDEWFCDPNSMFYTNPELDYTIVKIKKKNGKSVGAARGFLNIRNGVDIHNNQRVNIIQHPQGLFQQIAFRDNTVEYVSDSIIQYTTDTQKGSSGAPVLDDYFNVVALHNQTVPDPSDPYRYYRNQGTSFKAILEDAFDFIPK